MRKVTITLAALLFTLVAGAQASQKIVSFDAAYRDGSITRNIERIGGEVTREFKLIDAVVAVFPDNVKTAEISSIPGVTRVTEDEVINWLESSPTPMQAVQLPNAAAVRAALAASEPVAVSKAGPETNPSEIPWGVKRVNAAGAWNFSEGAGVKVAVIDTGVDYNHPDLKDNYFGGYNAIVTTMTPLDDHGHGTHVAGTIAALRNGTGVIGVAPKAMIYGVKVLSKSGSGSYSGVMAGIEWAALNGMHVINMSLGGGGYNQDMHNIIKAANAAGVTIVCAAGNNSGAVNYPAKYPESIAISASDSSDRLASFSCKGPEIVVVAPGVSINSTRLGGGYTSMSGTSMACPHAAGLAALAVAAGANTPDAVRQALMGAATLLPNLKPTDQGAGMVDAAKLPH